MEVYLINTASLRSQIPYQPPPPNNNSPLPTLLVLMSKTFTKIGAFLKIFHILLCHHDITMGNDIAKDTHCDIIMGYDVVIGTYRDVTMQNEVEMMLIYYVLLRPIMVLLFS